MFRTGLHKFTKLIATAGLASLGSTAGAFDASDNINTSVALGSCTVNRVVDASTQTAYVELSWFGNLSYAGGSGFRNGSVFTGTGIDTNNLGVCLTVAPGDITNIRQNGADGTFASDDYMGFFYTRAGSTSEYKIGSGSFPVPNVAPTANAGADQAVQSGNTVTLSGSGTDSDGTIASYAWTRTGGSGSAANASLSSASAQNPTFTDSSVAIGGTSVTHIFSLVVTDDDGATSAADSVSITITAPPNTAPTAVANAIPNPAVSGQTVTLNGGSSSANDSGQALTYAWSQTGGSPTVDLSSATAVSPTFTAPTLTPGASPITLTFSLTVNDGIEDSVADTVDVVINAPPDTTAPAIASLLRQSPASQATNADTLTWRLTFSEAVVNVDPTDFVYSGTTATLGVTGSGTTYDLTLSGGDLAGLNSTVFIGIEVSSTDIRDAAGNTFAGDIIGFFEANYAVDNGQDGVLLTGPSGSVTGPFSVTLDFLQNGPAGQPRSGQTDLNTVLTGLDITNATRSGGSSFGGSRVTFELTPSAPGTVTVSLPAGVAFDEAGNPNAASNVLSVTAADTEAPVVTVPADISVATDAGAATANVTYATPTASDNVAVTSGPTLTAGLASGSDFPLGTTTVTYTASDAAGNTGTASFTVTVTDGEAPVITTSANLTVSTDPGENTAVVTYAAASASDNVGVTSGPTRTAGLASGAAFPLGTTTVSFSASDAEGNIGTASFTVTVVDNEAPVVTTSADITVTAPAGQNAATVSYATPTASDNVAVTSGPNLTAVLASGSSFPVGVTTVTFTAADAASNTGSSSFTVTVLDAEAPVLTVPSDLTVATDPGVSTAVVTYAAPTATDNVAVTSGPTLVSGIASGGTFPLGTTTVTYSVADGSGNTTTASFNVTVEDREAPVITAPATITAEAGPGGTASVAFAATVTDNVDSGLAPVFRLGGAVITSPHVFAVGTSTVTVDAQDTAGNTAGQQSIAVTVSVGVPPNAPLITTADINLNRSLTIGGTAEADSTVRVTFPDSSFQEVTATGGVFSVTSAADMVGGTVTVIATDAQGNVSDAATVDLFPDYDSPTVTITGAPTSLNDLTPFEVVVTFSEALDSYDGSLTISGATATLVSSASPVFTFEITPLEARNITMQVPAGAAEDIYGNPSLASNEVQVTNAVLSETEQMMTTAARLNQLSLIHTQPHLQNFLSNELFGNAFISATRHSGSFDLTTSTGRSVWAATRGQWSRQDEMESSYAHLAFGAHYKMQPNVLLGVMGQIDNSRSNEGDASLESTGWLIGPYAVARMENQPLVFTGSYLMGQSDNMISPLGTFEDSYQSDRNLLTLGVTGEIAMETLTLRPVLDFARVSEESEAYIDGASNPVRALTTTTTELTVGLDFVKPIASDCGHMFLLGGIGANLSRVEETFETSDDASAQLEIGFRYEADNGGVFSTRTNVMGLGNDGYESYGAEFSYEIRF